MIHLNPVFCADAFFAMILTCSSLLPSPFSGAKPFDFFERTCFFVSFCFSPALLFFRRVFVFVLVSVLGRSGRGTLPRLLNSERIPFTIRGKL